MPTSCRRLSGPDRTQLSIPMTETSPSPHATGCACAAKKKTSPLCLPGKGSASNKSKTASGSSPSCTTISNDGLRPLDNTFGPGLSPMSQNGHRSFAGWASRAGPVTAANRRGVRRPSRPMLVSITFGAIGRRSGSNRNSRNNACFLTIGYRKPENGRPGAGRSPCGRNWPLLNSGAALFRAFDCLSGDGPFLIFRHPAVSRLFRDA